jgi:hypothetical protein
MPQPSEIIKTVAVLMNDAAQTQYNNVSCLPLLNLALDELQELYELNEIPVTNEVSAAITIKAGIDRLGFDTTPALPSDLIEIKQIWESIKGSNSYTPVVSWTWEHGRLKFTVSKNDLDLKINYIGSIFNTPILIKDINVDLPFNNIKTYLEYKTTALCAMFIAENPTRALALDSLAGTALSRALGIPIKGMQSIVTRRRPFRASFKRRGTNY